MNARLDAASTERIHFRPAVPADAPSIARLHNAEGPDRWSPEGVLSRLRGRSPDHPLLVAEDRDARVRACFTLTPDPCEHGAALAMLSVEPDAPEELSARCLVVLWRQADALGYAAMTTDDALPGLDLRWEPTASGQRLDLAASRDALKAAESRLLDEDMLGAGGSLPVDQTLAP